MPESLRTGLDGTPIEGEIAEGFREHLDGMSVVCLRPANQESLARNVGLVEPPDEIIPDPAMLGWMYTS